MSSINARSVGGRKGNKFKNTVGLYEKPVRIRKGPRDTPKKKRK